MRTHQRSSAIGKNYITFRTARKSQEPIEGDRAAATSTKADGSRPSTIGRRNDHEDLVIVNAMISSTRPWQPMFPSKLPLLAAQHRSCDSSIDHFTVPLRRKRT